MSEYNHEMFPCDMPANTPGFNRGYVKGKWNTPHDENGNLIKKEYVPEKPCECIAWPGTKLSDYKDGHHVHCKNPHNCDGVTSKKIKTITVPAGATLSPEIEQKIKTGGVVVNVKKDCECRTWAGYFPESWGKNSKGEEHHTNCEKYKD